MTARDPAQPNRYGARCAKLGRHRWRKPPKGNPAYGIGGYMKTGILMICDRCGEPLYRKQPEIAP